MISSESPSEMNLANSAEVPAVGPQILSFSFCLDFLWLKSQNHGNRAAIPKRSVLHSTYCPGPLRASRVTAPTDVGRKECLQMCDYSLDFVASRPAKVGDKLVTTRFPNSLTRGFAAIGEPNVAVCLLPGTEVAFENEVKYEPSMKHGNFGKKLAQFRQINVDRP